MSGYQLSLPLVEPATTEDVKVRALLDAGKKAARGMLPNMYLAMANAPGLLATYLHGYQQLREETTFSPAELEVLFLAISMENGCDYCVAAHSLVADLASVPRAVTDAIRDGQPIDDPRLAALDAMAREMLLSRGRPGEAAVEAFLAAGYTERQLLEIVLVIGIKTLSNYSNHLFDTPLDSVFKVREYRAFKLGQKLVQVFRPRRVIQS